jgi:hypothetical protein
MGALTPNQRLRVAVSPKAALRSAEAQRVKGGFGTVVGWAKSSKRMAHLTSSRLLS